MSAIRGVALFGLVLALVGCSTHSAREVTTAPADVAASARVPRVPMVWVPKWGVHVIEGYDIVYYEQAYYFYVERHWYIARSPAGPWALVPAPPPAVAALPPGAFHLYLSGERGQSTPAR
jgi:hypothetical protein